MMDETEISAKFPFQSNYMPVHGSKMHYIDAGEGDPILFLHGNPTSSYLWRNIIPHLTSSARCIAPDLIGMGKSDQPNIAYRFEDHAAYLDEFIEKLALENITLVVHDWGSGLGFHYAQQHPANIKGIAFLEAILGNARWHDFPTKFRIAFRLFRMRGVGWFLLSVLNLFVNQVLSQATMRTLTSEEMRHYRAPYPTIKARKPVRVWPQEIPIGGTPADVTQKVRAYHRWLQQTTVPKLLFYAHPGGIIRSKQVKWCKDHLQNMDTTDLGKGIHYLQEDHPHKMGERLAGWYETL